MDKMIDRFYLVNDRGYYFECFKHGNLMGNLSLSKAWTFDRLEEAIEFQKEIFATYFSHYGIVSVR